MEEKHRHRRLYRSLRDRKLAGICGGLGEFFDIDPVLIRLLWIIAFFATNGLALLVYVIAIFIIPNNPEEVPQDKP